MHTHILAQKAHKHTHTHARIHAHGSTNAAFPSVLKVHFASVISPALPSVSSSINVGFP